MAPWPLESRDDGSLLLDGGESVCGLGFPFLQAELAVGIDGSPTRKQLSPSDNAAWF